MDGRERPSGRAMAKSGLLSAARPRSRTGGADGTAVRPPLNLSAAGATNKGSLDRGRPGRAVGLGGIMHQSRPLAAASAALVCGSIASASGVVVQIAGHEGDGKAVIAAVSQSLSTIAAIPLSPSTIATAPPSPGTIAAVPLSPSTTPSAVVSPPPPARSAPAVSAPVKRQDSASPSNSPQTTRLDAFAPAVTASTTAATTDLATTDLAEQPVPAPKKSQKAARSANERNRGWNDAAGWGRYGHEKPTSSW
jgi:hypothetical protein